MKLPEERVLKRGNSGFLYSTSLGLDILWDGHQQKTAIRSSMPVLGPSKMCKDRTFIYTVYKFNETY